MDENNNIKKAPNVPPFLRYCSAIIPTAFDDSLSYYEALCALYKFLQDQVINTINNNANVTQYYIGRQNELEALFNQLKDYVDTYFENLDVQEEINNKLDKMAEDGTLENLIENTAFKNLDISSNYTITTEKRTGIDLVYHVTRLHSNLESNNIPLRNVLCGDSFVESVVDANEKNLYEMSKKNIRPVFMSNCDSKGSMNNCVVIRDGKVYRQNATGSIYTICGLTSDGSFKVYPRLESATQPVTDGVVNTWGCSIIVSNGSIDQTTWSDAGSDLTDNKHPRTVMLQLQNDKDIYFVHVEGRTAESTGLTFLETANLILSDFPTVNNAVLFGGGGDTQLMIYGDMINKCNDQQLRPLYEAIYLDANVDYEQYNTASKEIADARIFNDTLFDYIKSLPLTDGYKYGDELVELSVADSDQYHQYLTGSVNSKVVFEKDSIIFVKFPDLSSYEWNTTVRLNIHYDIGSTTKDIKTEDGYSVQPYMVSNKILALKYSVANKEYTLISDLKAIEVVPYSQSRDLDTFKNEGVFSAIGWVNCPNNFASTAVGGIVKVEKSPVGDFIYQTFHSTDNVIYTRVFHNSSWGEWNTLQGSARVNKNGLDCDTLINKFVMLYGNNLTNKPAGSQNGTIINIPFGSDGYNSQIYLERGITEGRGLIYHRNQENGTWGSWEKFTVS